MIAHPKPNPAIENWLRRLLSAGSLVYISEIADYEVRRELNRANLVKSISRLDRLQHRLGYIPITTATMLLAASYWARLRNQGQALAPDPALDADVILAAQSTILAARGRPVIVASENATHLARLVPAISWQDPTWP
jgi:predicted nucleic acid-binding protein